MINYKITLHFTPKSIPNIKIAQPSPLLGYPAREIRSLQQ